MSNKFIIAALLLAWGGAATATPTIGELSSLNAELKKQELQNKLDEAKAKNSNPSNSTTLPALPVPAQAQAAAPVMPVAPISGAAVESEDIRLLAIYGVDDDLKAEIQYNGNPFTLSKKNPNGNPKLGTWTVAEITPFRIVLSKPSKASKKGGAGSAAQKAVYVSSSTSTDGDSRNLKLFASPASGMASPTPLPPMPGGMPSAAPTFSRNTFGAPAGVPTMPGAK